MIEPNICHRLSAALECETDRLRSDVPNVNFLVHTAGGEEHAARMPAHYPHWCGMGERLGDFPSRDLANFDVNIFMTGYRQPLTGRIERKSPRQGPFGKASH